MAKRPAHMPPPALGPCIGMLRFHTSMQGRFSRCPAVRGRQRRAELSPFGRPVPIAPPCDTATHAVCHWRQGLAISAPAFHGICCAHGFAPSIRVHEPPLLPAASGSTAAACMRRQACMKAAQPSQPQGFGCLGGVHVLLLPPWSAASGAAARRGTGAHLQSKASSRWAARAAGRFGSGQAPSRVIDTLPSSYF